MIQLTWSNKSRVANSSIRRESFKTKPLKNLPVLCTDVFRISFQISHPPSPSSPCTCIHIAVFNFTMCMAIMFYFGRRLEVILLFLDLLCNVSCGGQSTTFAYLLTDVFVPICIGSDVNIICPETNLLYLFGFTN